jgi:molybdopterin-guanine dinucleotide biosynthesis protein A
MIVPMENLRMGFILAGGQGSRMGTDKAFLNFGGCTLLERAITVLRPVCDVVIVGDPAKFSDYGSVIEDAYPGCGPLAGIHSALTHSSADLNLVLAVDMPLVSTDLLAFLFASAASTSALVTVPHSARGFQPLCAVYRRPFATVADQALKAGKNKIDALFAAIPIRVIEGEELAFAGFSDQVFLNLNTPEDLQTKWPGPDQAK